MFLFFKLKGCLAFVQCCPGLEHTLIHIYVYKSMMCLRVEPLIETRLVTGEAWQRTLEDRTTGKQGLLSQGKTQGFQWCEVADDPVVVLKSQPVKTGNRLEVKIGMTTVVCCRSYVAKIDICCEGVNETVVDESVL